jgi:hypothetical protein
VPGGLVPVTPHRILDSPLQGWVPLAVPVGGRDGVPADATAAVVNIAGTAAGTAITLTAWPAGTARPQTSVLNLVRGSAAANLAVVGLDAGGQLAIGACGGTSHVAVDLVGYLAPGAVAAGGISPVPPFRLLDTRRAGNRRPLGAGAALQVRPWTSGRVPVAGVAAVVMTVTAASSTVSGGGVTAWPSGAARPPTSNLNPRADRPVAATVTVAAGPDGGVNLYNMMGSTHLVVDVVGYVVAAAPAVAPVSWSTMDTSPMASGAAGQARRILLTANRYALSTWWPGAAVALLGRPMDAGAQNDRTDAVRRLSMEALGLAVSLRTGAYDEAAVGAPAATAQSVAVALVDRVVGAHLANRPGGWGDSWQSAMWSSLAGRAGWLLWDGLPADTRLRLARMVEWEADYSLVQPVLYLRDRRGTVVRPGNTGAEEDAWFALAPALATAMFPNSPHWTAWRYQQERMQIAAWARPADVASGRLVDGRPLAQWLQGSNVESNGAVTNHDRVAPDYSTNAYQNVDAVLVAALAGTAAPQASVAGLGPVYLAMSAVRYPAPPYAAPGGSVYRAGSAGVYYPRGCDWGTGQQLPYALFDAQAAVFGFDATGRAAGQSGLHATAEEVMQARTGTGATYLQPSSEYYYVGREEHSAQLAAQLYLTYFVQRLGARVAASASTWAPGAAPAGAPPAAPAGSADTARIETGLGARR